MSTKEMSQAQQDVYKQAAVFSILADPTRLKLVKLLQHQHDTHALCVNALANLLGVTQSAVSQHLRVLKAGGLVKRERHGYYIHYFVNQEILEKYRRLVTEAFNTEGIRSKRFCEKHCPSNKVTNGSRPTQVCLSPRTRPQMATAFDSESMLIDSSGP